MPGDPSAAEPGAKTDRVARAVRRFFAADAAIAVGELRPEGDGGARVPLAVTGATGEHRDEVRLPEAGGAPARDRVVLGALNLLRRHLLPA